MPLPDTLTHDETKQSGKHVDELRPALAVVWSHHGRNGEVLLFPRAGETHVFGRGGVQAEDAQPRALLVRQRPGKNASTEPLDDPFLSRAQLRLTAEPNAILVENAGKCPLLDANGATTELVRLAPGDVAEVKGRLLLLCCMRPSVMPQLESAKIGAAHAFGSPDEVGFVGESPLAWALRDQIAFVSIRSVHVLLLGASGSGKEIVARAIHALSQRKHRKMVARNAATLPSGIIDAELFGNVANYPNAGMPERPGLIGEADGSTLFLDEIGDLSEELQTRLLRVLDDGGEYQRLGDARRRTADLRFIGATNRSIDALKHDLAARLRLRLTLPGLGERREDVALLAASLLRRIAREDPDIARRFIDESGAPRIAIALMSALVRHDYRTHVRELDGLLWSSMATSRGTTLELTDAVRDQLSFVSARIAPQDLTAEDVRAALERAGGKQERAWRELGLANRFVLQRLLKKFGIKSEG